MKNKNFAPPFYIYVSPTNEFSLLSNDFKYIEDFTLGWNVDIVTSNKVDSFKLLRDHQLN